jgi:CHAT domain
MNELTFVPMDRVAIVHDQVKDFVELIDDPDRRWHSEAIVLIREEEWAGAPLYYVLAQDDLETLVGELGTAPFDFTRERLFELLDIHKHTRADQVVPGETASRPAVQVDAGGAITGVWAEVEPPALAAEPAEDSGEAVGEAAEKGLEFSIPDAGPAAPPAPATANGEPSAPADDRRGVDEPQVESLFRRTPHMDLSEPEPVAPGSDFGASVYLDTQAAEPGETSTEVVLDLPEDLEQIDIEVMLAATDHFVVKGECIRTLSMHRDDERSPDVTFDLAVREDAPPDGAPPMLTAYLTYQHRPSGRVHRSVEIQGIAAAAETPPEESIPEPVAPDELAIDARAEPADLTIDVVRTPDNDGRHFLVTLRTTLLDDFAMSEPEPWNFPQDTDAYVAGMMSQFTLKGASPFDRQASLKGAGVALWEKAPTCFQDLFWRLLDEGHPLRTIYVASEEPHIPWELMRPRRPLPDGGVEQRDVLGVEFVIGRWVHPGHRSPKQQDPLDESYVVAPTYPVKPLKTASAEAQWVCERFGGTQVTPATQARLDQMLRERPVDLLHFVAHGKSNPQAPQTLLLEQGAVFNSLQVRGMDGLENACRTKAPLVFLNACEVGLATPSLVGAGGFASEFISAGARCVVAPIWSVKDSLAHEVAVAFYEAALEEPTRPFADILRDIRAKAYEAADGEDTYAAYCFYGDPLTSLQASTM